jgi:hypothetical protein
MTERSSFPGSGRETSSSRNDQNVWKDKYGGRKPVSSVGSTGSLLVATGTVEQVRAWTTLAIRLATV